LPKWKPLHCNQRNSNFRLGRKCSKHSHPSRLQRTSNQLCNNQQKLRQPRLLQRTAKQLLLPILRRRKLHLQSCRHPELPNFRMSRSDLHKLRKLVQRTSRRWMHHNHHSKLQWRRPLHQLLLQHLSSKHKISLCLLRNSNQRFLSL